MTRDPRKLPTPLLPGLAIVLVEPRVPENVGAVSRAMMNCGLSDLRLVTPRCNHLGRSARAVAVGTEAILGTAAVFDTLEEALADRGTVMATVPRRPTRSYGLVPIREAAPLMIEAARPPATAAILFGREDNGLSAEELSLASHHVAIPCADQYPVLNLAQSVLLVGHEIYSALDPPLLAGRKHPSPPAARDELGDVLEHLDRTMRLLRCPEGRRVRIERDLAEVLTRLPWESKQLAVLHTLLHIFDVYHLKRKWLEEEDGGDTA